MAKGLWMEPILGLRLKKVYLTDSDCILLEYPSVAFVILNSILDTPERCCGNSYDEVQLSAEADVAKAVQIRTIFTPCRPLAVPSSFKGDDTAAVNEKGTWV